MDIHLAQVNEKHLVFRMLQFHLHDLSLYSGDELKEDGEFEYRYFEDYWADLDRQVYLCRIAGDIVGFAMVNKFGISAHLDQSMAEFFILNKYRGKGIGRRFACSVFDMYPGIWEVLAYRENVGAVSFWSNVLNGYVRGDLEVSSKMIGESVRSIWLFEKEEG